MNNTARTNLRSLRIGLCASILCFVISSQSLTAAPGGEEIVLPSELIAGEPATLAVLTSGGHVAPGVSIVLSNGQVLTTDESGRAHFLVPRELGPLFARIPGSGVRAVADVLPQQSSSGDLQLAHVQRIAAPGDLLIVAGSGFEGDADRNTVEIDGKRTLVLASSPAQLVLTPSASIAPGSARLLIRKDRSEAAANLTLINVTPMSPSDMQVRVGKEIEIVLFVQGTMDPVNMEVKVLTPQLVQLSHGDELFVQTAGGRDNSATIRFKGLAAGEFSYSVSIEDTSAKANVQLACDFLRAAEKAAGASAGKKIQSILNGLQRERFDAKRFREELQKIAKSNNEPDFQALITAADRSLGDQVPCCENVTTSQ